MLLIPSRETSSYRSCITCFQNCFPYSTQLIPHHPPSPLGIIIQWSEGVQQWDPHGPLLFCLWNHGVSANSSLKCAWTTWMILLSVGLCMWSWNGCNAGYRAGLASQWMEIWGDLYRLKDCIHASIHSRSLFVWANELYFAWLPPLVISLWKMLDIAWYPCNPSIKPWYDFKTSIWYNLLLRKAIKAADETGLLHDSYKTTP